MKTHSTKSQLEMVAEARDVGIIDPVILYLDHNNSHAQAIHQELHGNIIDPEDTGYGNIGAIEMLPRAEVIRLLPRHCDNAGNLLANMLQKPEPAQHRVLMLWKCNSILQTVTDTRTLYFHLMGYDYVRLRLHQSETKASVKNDNTFWLLEFDDGEMVPLCAPTKTVFAVGLLTVFVTTHTCWVERDKRMIAIEAFDADLAEELLSKNDRPEVVAETIRALRKMGPDKDCWLMRVLWGANPCEPSRERSSTN